MRAVVCDDFDGARRAASALPGWLAVPDPDMSERERRFILWFVGVLFVVGPAWGFAVIWRQPWGWLFVLAGLPAWLAVRFLFFRIRGTETATFAVDDRGVIHVVSGRRAVRRLMGLYDQGVQRWMRRGVGYGVLIGVGGPFALAGLCILLDSPAPAVVFLTGGLFACLDLVRFMARMFLRPLMTGHRLLHGAMMLPDLALYARHHGWQAATSGVRADDLAATLAAHPDEVRIAQAYKAATASLSRIAARAV